MSRVIGAALLMLIVAPGTAASQSVANERVWRTNTNSWFAYEGEHEVRGRFGLWLDAALRRADIVEDPQQVVVRPGVTWELMPRVKVAAGYAYSRIYPYGELPEPTEIPEHRSWQQLSLEHEALLGQWQHRFRVEQRWEGEPIVLPSDEVGVSGWKYKNRLRYQARFTMPVLAPLGIKRGPYLTLADEVFIGFGRNVELNVFEQNRASLAIGYSLGRAARFEAGYLHQILLKPNGRDVEGNHTILFRAVSEASFKPKPTR
jgi:hypothetical protein